MTLKTIISNEFLEIYKNYFLNEYKEKTNSLGKLNKIIENGLEKEKKQLYKIDKKYLTEGVIDSESEEILSQKYVSLCISHDICEIAIKAELEYYKTTPGKIKKIIQNSLKILFKTETSLDKARSLYDQLNTRLVGIEWTSSKPPEFYHEKAKCKATGTMLAGYFATRLVQRGGLVVNEDENISDTTKKTSDSQSINYKVVTVKALDDNGMKPEYKYFYLRKKNKVYRVDTSDTLKVCKPGDNRIAFRGVKIDDLSDKEIADSSNQSAIKNKKEENNEGVLVILEQDLNYNFFELPRKLDVLPLYYCKETFKKEDGLSKKDAAAIERCLVAQMKKCNAQMANEPIKKEFPYFNPPNSWKAVVHKGDQGGYKWVAAHAKGRRSTMEDEHLATSFDVRIGKKTYPVQLFGVFDGHGGMDASHFVSKKLAQKLKDILEEFNPDVLNEADIWRALRMTFVQLNQDLEKVLEDKDKASKPGTTATIAMILDGFLWTANVGDSRTVLNNNGTAVQLSHDAKPDDDDYQKGIERREGIVVTSSNNKGSVPRVNGRLAVARALGDYHLNGAVSARPKITKKSMNEIDAESHLILCCDGVYDVARTVDVVNAVQENKHKDSLETLAKSIIYSAYAARSSDNLSALVVKIS